MIFGVAEIVWWCSQYFIMEPGDIIVTGTPSGVALGMKPTEVPQRRRRGRARLRRPRHAEAEDRQGARLIVAPRTVAKTKAPGQGPGLLVLRFGSDERSVAGEDRSGELVVQAGANDVFLEADIVHERRRSRCRICRDRRRDIRSWRVQLPRKAYSRPAPTVQPSWLLDAEADEARIGTLTVALTLP